MLKGHRIERFEDVDEFLEGLKNLREADVECTPHTFFRLSEKQRKLFTEGELKHLLFCERPLRVGIQCNGNHALYYKHKDKSTVIKVIVSFKPAAASIITFYVLDISELPRG
ncbi:MAG: hypothetical protein AB1626_05460 [Candidatus Micrarchaeota archaeon]